MKLIVGLGNPATIYRNSRHNIGMRIVKKMANEYKIKLTKDKNTLCKRGIGKIKDLRFVLAHPLVFMNLSGKSVNLLLEKYKIPLKNFLVIYDDLDLDLGKLRIRPRGSSGGHKGIKSIIECIGTDDFARLRIGIGRTDSKGKVKDFVLSSFSKQEENILKKKIEVAIDCCRMWLLEGVVQAMNRYN